MVVVFICMLLGIVFMFMGYLIYFKGKYDLINGYTEAQKNGSLDETYAKGVGKIELISGAVACVLGPILALTKLHKLIIVGIIFVYFMTVCVILLIHQSKSYKK